MNKGKKTTPWKKKATTGKITSFQILREKKLQNNNNNHICKNIQKENKAYPIELTRLSVDYKRDNIISFQVPYWKGKK